MWAPLESGFLCAPEKMELHIHKAARQAALRRLLPTPTFPGQAQGCGSVWAPAHLTLVKSSEMGSAQVGKRQGVRTPI